LLLEGESVDPKSLVVDLIANVEIWAEDLSPDPPFTPSLPRRAGVRKGLVIYPCFSNRWGDRTWPTQPQSGRALRSAPAIILVVWRYRERSGGSRSWRAEWTDENGSERGYDKVGPRMCAPYHVTSNSGSVIAASGDVCGVRRGS
jgi:hypothetical protein